MTNVWRATARGRRWPAPRALPRRSARSAGSTRAQRAWLAATVDEMARQGVRVLGVARATVAADALPETQQGFAFAFLGLVGFADPLRANVPDAVRECRSAGIRVVMITGDYPATAEAIAARAGLDTGSVVTGDELARLDDATLAARLRTANVFARIAPEQKLRIVEALKANGEVVAMTGDGVNDAPSLKAAHIGIAMGGRGTDVAREASSIVLLDDDFASIVRTVRLGRRIYDNLRKAMAYIVAVHVPIAGLALLPLLFGLPLLLTPIHIAFLEMVIDPACSIVFEAEPDESRPDDASTAQHGQPDRAAPDGGLEPPPGRVVARRPGWRVCQRTCPANAGRRIARTGLRFPGADQCQPDPGQPLVQRFAADGAPPAQCLAVGPAGRRGSGALHCPHLAAGDGTVPLRAAASRRSQRVGAGGGRHPRAARAGQAVLAGGLQIVDLNPGRKGQMPMFKSILVPVDVVHKSSWQKAIPEAIAMTKAAHGKLVVMTVVRETTAMLGAVRTRLQLQKHARRSPWPAFDDRAEIFRERAEDRGGSPIWQYRSRDSGGGKGSESRSHRHGITSARDARLSHWPERRARRAACTVFGPCSATEGCHGSPGSRFCIRHECEVPAEPGNV